MPRRRKRALPLILATILAATSALALDPAKPVNQYVRTSWTSANGLPQDTIYSILQTRSGYMWFGTGEGLVRFDGIRFTVFDKTQFAGLRSNVVVSLLEDKRDESLWIGAYRDGLIHYNPKTGEYHHYTMAEGLAGNSVWTLAQDLAGDLWVGTDKGLSRLHNNNLTIYATAHLDGYSIQSLAVVSNALWLIAGERVRRLDLHTGAIIDAFLDIRDATRLYFDHQHRLWIGTRTHGLYVSIAENRVTHLRDVELTKAPISMILQDHEGQVWTSQLTGVCRLSDHNRSECLAGNVASLYEDREGSIWIGTGDSGVMQLKDREFRIYDKGLDLTSEMVYALYENSEGLWMGTASGISLLKAGHVTSYLSDTSRSLEINTVTAIADGGGGALWLGTPAGIKLFKNGRVVRSYTTRDGLASPGVHALFRDHLGNLWIGNGGDRGGLTVFANGKFKTLSEKDGLSTNRVRTIFEDKHGILWFGTNKGLTALMHGKFVNFDNEADTTCIYEDSADSGDFWVGTSNAGLFRFRNGQFTSVYSKNGLLASGVWSAIGKEGFLWLTSNRGLFRVSKRDLNDFAEKRIATVPYTSYGVKDGLPLADFNGGYQASGWKTKDGRILFGSVRGVVELDLHRQATNSVTVPVVLEAALLDQQRLRDGSRNPVGTGRLEFEFAALSFLSPENTNYKYQLVGFDKDWISSHSPGIASYTNVPPGTYTFRVIASNPDGTWNFEGTSIRFVLKPRFSQTTWFYGLCALSLVLLGIAVATVRNRRIRANERRLAHLVDIRTEQLLEATEQAKAATKAKSEFLANMSHEIRTPLNGLLGMVELAAGTSLTGEQQQYINTATHSGRVLLNVLNDILDYSKIEAGKMTLNLEPFDSAEVFSSIREIGASSAEKKGLSFSYHIDSDVPPQLLGDSGRLTQVLLNLLYNAIKFTAQGSISLKIGLASRNAEMVTLKICVEDTGIGISKDNQELIFRAFEQGDRSTSRRFGGTGLGLSIVSYLVEQMNGQIWVESELGHGSSFYITPEFKVCQSDSLAKADPPRARDENADAPPHPLTMLLAEDNPVNQLLAVRLLEKAGYQVTVVANGQEAIDTLKDRSFDVVLMDVQMPEVDGITATQIIRAAEAFGQERVPIIAMTAHAMDGDRARCFAAGMDGYISKPINSVQLMTTIADVWRDAGGLGTGTAPSIPQPDNCSSSPATLN
jgi:signal transduction histidine kinase/ligand-binding sensor domain-containing protein/ActR/RegA family two-component response regulator